MAARLEELHTTRSFHRRLHRSMDSKSIDPGGYSRINPFSSMSTSSLAFSSQPTRSIPSSMCVFWRRSLCVFVVFLLASGSTDLSGSNGGGFNGFSIGIMSSAAADGGGSGSNSIGSSSTSASSSALVSTTDDDESSGSQQHCFLKGRVYTERLWYGYLLDKAFHRDFAKIQYTISYPVRECCVNLLIYYDDQVRQLTSDMTCEQREKVLPPNNNQVIPLHTLNSTVGCRIWNESGEEPFYVCVGERIFRSSGPRTWYFALSRCGAKTSLSVNYSFNVSGYYGDCEEDPLVRTYVPASPKESGNVYVSVALGIVAGIAVIAAVVFFALWFLARRRAAGSKGSSVTSSQATMTQDDIFYVNPSLSDREQQDYGTSQASSENYYEVIPDRRSYESINPHLLAAGPGGAGAHHPLIHHHHLHPHLHAHGTHPRVHHHPMLNHLHPAAAHHPPQGNTQVKDSAFHRPHPQTMSGYPPVSFDDYPPPPYQPPHMLAAKGHHSLHHPGHRPMPHQQNQVDALSLSRMAGTSGGGPRPHLIHHAASLSFPVMAAQAANHGPANASALNPAATSSFGNGGIIGPGSNSVASSAAALSGMISNLSGITSTSPVTMNTTTNTVSLGETSA